MTVSEPHIELVPADAWIRSESDDLAVYRVEDGLRFRHEPLERQLTQTVIDDYSIGIGDEVVSVGRFMDLEGHRKNRPMLRSGVIACFPEIPCATRRGPIQNSYIV